MIKAGPPAKRTPRVDQINKIDEGVIEKERRKEIGVVVFSSSDGDGVEFKLMGG